MRQITQLRVEQSLIAESEIVAVYDDGIVCKLCKPYKFLSQAGTHFKSVHGLPLRKKMPHCERLKIYGLPAGTRLASRGLRDVYQKNASVARFGEKRRLPPQKQFSAAKILGASKAQRESFDKIKHIGAQFKKADAVRFARCKNCGKEFQYVRWTDKKMCSQACSRSWVIKNVLSCPSVRAASAKTFSNLRKKRYWSSRPPEKYRTTRQCIVCGKDFSFINSRNRGLKNPNRFCSFSCYTQYRRSPHD